MTADAYDTAAEIAGAVSAVRGVARLDAGLAGHVATFGPGNRVTGVTIDGKGIRVRVVIEQDTKVSKVDKGVRSAVSRVSPLPVHLEIADIAERNTV